jgi:hypothetical protein
MLHRSSAVPSLAVPEAPVRHYLAKFPTGMLAAITGPDGRPVQLAQLDWRAVLDG